MAETYTAVMVEPDNHNWNFSESDNNTIIALEVTTSVTYSNGTDEIIRREKLDIWPLLSATQKAKIKTAYEESRQLFDNHFIGEA
jgi:hypothetical protein